MTAALVDRFVAEYPSLSRDEVTAAVDAALAQYTRDGLVFSAADVVNNVRTRLDDLLPEEPEEKAPESPTYRSSPRPATPPPPKPRGLIRRLLDCIRG